MFKNIVSYLIGLIIGLSVKSVVAAYNWSFHFFRNHELLKGFKKSGAYPGFIRGPIIQKSKQFHHIGGLNQSIPLSGNAKKVVYTVNTGGYDDVAPLFYKPENCEFLLFTDNPKIQVDGWETVLLDNPLNLNPFLLSRMPKLLPHRFLKDYDLSVYVDGNYELLGDICDLFDYLNTKSLGLFRHESGDNCIIKELKRIKNLKISPLVFEMENQVKNYFYDGLPKGFGLFECGIITRKHQDPLLIETMEKWWCEFRNYPYRDQLSLPYALWKTGVDYQVIKGNQWRSELFVRKNHKR